MVKCASDKDVLRVFTLVELYIIVIIVSVLGAIYIVSIVPLRPDVLRMMFLALTLLVVVYTWYKLTIKILHRRINLFNDDRLY